jgi:hypothetical protein
MGVGKRNTVKKIYFNDNRYTFANNVSYKYNNKRKKNSILAIVRGLTTFHHKIIHSVFCKNMFMFPIY